MSNKEVKTEAWCICHPHPKKERKKRNTIKEYFTLILLGLKKFDIIEQGRERGAVEKERKEGRGEGRKNSCIYQEKDRQFASYRLELFLNLNK